MVLAAVAHGQTTSPATTTPAADVAFADGFTPFVPRMIDEKGIAHPVPPHFTLGGPLALEDGRVLMFYSPGKDIREQRDIHVAESHDGGLTWVDDRVIERHPDDSVRHGRPLALLDRDGRTIHLFYYGWIRYGGQLDNSRSDVWTMRSTDGGRTWTERQLLWKGGFNGVVQPPVQTPTGRILLPFARLAGTARFVAGATRSDDGGATWHYVDGIDVPAQADEERRAHKLTGGAMEPTIATLADGRILMLIRTITGTFWQSISTDDGATWPPPKPSALDCGGTGILYNLPDDRLLFVWNPADPEQIAKRGYPHGMDRESFAVSVDQGQSWSKPRVFASGPRLIHSLVVQPDIRRLLITMPERSLMLHVPLADVVALPPLPK
jgi:hypothetical protein